MVVHTTQERLNTCYTLFLKGFKNYAFDFLKHHKSLHRKPITYNMFLGYIIYSTC